MNNEVELPNGLCLEPKRFLFYFFFIFCCSLFAFLFYGSH